MYGKFVCALCGGKFTKNRSDEEALAEAVAAFGKEIMASHDCNLAVVCDTCYQRLKQLEATQTKGFDA